MTSPSPILFGVERIVVVCETDSSLSAIDRRTLCDQLIKKARSVTDLPVASATEDDTDLLTGNRAKQSKQLLLRVSAQSRDVEPGRKTLSLTVVPVRLVGGAVAKPIKSTASLVKVADSWTVQGPVDAFTKLLGSAPRKLRKPVRLDT